MKRKLHIKRWVLKVGLWGLPFLFCSCQAVQREHYKRTNFPIKGLNLVATRTTCPPQAFDSVEKVGANWVSVIPYAFVRPQNGRVLFNVHFQEWGERVEGCAQTVNMAHAKGLKVMVKPHLWVSHQGWAGDLQFDQDSTWQNWQQSYADYILTFARMADSTKAEAFCVGTEIRKLANAHPDYWKDLIHRVKKVYSGKITYAANWDNYQNIQFWSSCNFIGIDAYFPLEASSDSAVNEMVRAWQPYKQDLQVFSQQQNCPVVFTEMGYRSMDESYKGHWGEERVVNNKAQASAYEALFKSLSGEDWWWGGFIWKWYPMKPDARWDRPNTGFTPQGKPALKVLEKWYQAGK